MRSTSSLVLALFYFFVLSGCSIFAPLPEPSSTLERIASFPSGKAPLAGPVTIYWDDHLIPFIEARYDEDLPFALGMVHAHLRLAQMELYRRAAAGRLSESFGFYLADVDHGLRTLGLVPTAKRIESALPESTRVWIQRYVEGLNHYLEHTSQMPHEAEVMGYGKEPWTVTDVLTISRIFGADVNWLLFARLLPLWNTSDWDFIKERYLRLGRMSIPSFGPERGELIEVMGESVGRGSNSVAVGSRKTRHGAALMANDPHVGIQVPNLWMIGGIKSPSYHAVGLMFPGLPAVVIGRNAHVAWGGTNMRAASSDLVDVSSLDPSEFRERKETIRIRWWPDREVTIRECDWGPVITDLAYFEDYQGPPLALRWVGHEPSDEIGAVLAANRASNWRDFRAAWRTYAVSGQNVLYADDKGNVGQLLAVKLPVRGYDRLSDLLQDPSDPLTDWSGYLVSEDLPMSFNPTAGFIASANNLPIRTDPPVGFFFMDGDRIRRLQRTLEHAESVDRALLQQLHRDVFSWSAWELCRTVAEIMEDYGDEAGMLDALNSWNGELNADSREALAFQLLAHYLAKTFYESRLSEQGAEALMSSAAFFEILQADLLDTSKDEVRRCVRRALKEAKDDFLKWRTWGDVHRLRLNHFLGRIPFWGRRYRFDDFPASGGSTTLMKTAHGAFNGRQGVSYGSNARHISDLSDMDANWFVLLGGQDGRLGADNLLDQVPLWREGRYIQVPLRLETVRERFPHRTELEAAKETSSF